MSILANLFDVFYIFGVILLPIFAMAGCWKLIKVFFSIELEDLADIFFEKPEDTKEYQNYE